MSGRHSHMTNTRNTPVEALEYALPMRVLEYSLRDGSGGQGEYIGGEGIRRVYEFLTPATITLNSERRVYKPYGLQGGEAGTVGVNSITRHTSGMVEDVSGKYTGTVRVGDRVSIATPGGGGWGAKS